jgi:hypothetical protein
MDAVTMQLVFSTDWGFEPDWKRSFIRRMD